MGAKLVLFSFIIMLFLRIICSFVRIIKQPTMKISQIIFTVILLAGMPTWATAQQEVSKDSIPSTREEKNRNVMLNAKNDREPRQISIGLPAQFAADIFEDGLPVAELYWPVMPSTTWRNSLSLSSNKLMSLGESALLFGKMENIVSSENRHGGDKFLGLGRYSFNHFGKQQVDFNVSGPIAKGWGYTLGSYQSFDPGSNKLDVMSLQDRMEIYKAGINKRWNNNKGEVSLLYQYSANTTFADASGPFYFNGEDGSVEPFEDFNLGRDQYLPHYRAFHYLSLEDNKEYDVNIEKANRDHAHQLTLNFKYTWDNGTTLTVGSKLKDAQQRTATYNIAGIFEVTEADGYTYEDGTPYAGYVQNRHARRPYGIERSWMTSAQLTGKAGKRQQHSWRIGLNEWFSYQSMSYPTGLLPHEVKKNPRILLNNGQQMTAFNSGADYYLGHENRLAAYFSDDWTVNDRLWLSAGFRLDWQKLHGKGAFSTDVDGNVFDPSNIRRPGFTVATGKLYPFKGNWLNPSFTFNGRYRIVGGLGVLGEAVFVQQRPNMQDYAGCDLPNESPVISDILKGGIYFNNDWLELTSQVFHIQQTNYKSRTQFTNPNDQSETVTIAVLYDVATGGWTTAAVITPFKGFTFHGLLTLQNPLYKNFNFQPVFKDGPGEKYNFTDKNVTAISKMIIELDPSYQIEKWRFWLSFRYQSKQYINKTNTLYFKGRWETFGGIDYTLNDHLSFSLNLVNILNQKGASGNIGAADLATDVSKYQHHHLMAGNYIRPFTLELGASIKF